MSMLKAENEGLIFEGATANYWNADELKKLKEEAAEIRKLGFRAKVIKSLKNEWGGGDYVLMVESEYLKYKDAENHVYYIQNEKEYCDKIMAEAQKQINEIHNKANAYKELCDKYNIKY